MTDRDALVREFYYYRNDLLLTVDRVVGHIEAADAEGYRRGRAEVLIPVAKFRDELRKNARFADVDEARMQRDHADRLDKIIRALAQSAAPDADGGGS